MISFDVMQTLLRTVLKVGSGYVLARIVADENAVGVISAPGCWRWQE